MKTLCAPHIPRGVLSRESAALERPRRPGAFSPPGILRFRGDPERGAEAGVVGPGASHPPALRAGAPEVCAPRNATLSLAPPADAARSLASPRLRTPKGLGRARRQPG